MADNTATFALRIDADGEPAAEAAAELERFRGAIEKSQQAVNDYRKSLRMLKGTSDEVRDAREKLKAAIALEQGKIAQNNLAILKLGGSYEKLARAARKNRDATEANKHAIAAIGGPVKVMAERFDSVKAMLPALATGWGAFAAAIAVSVTAIGLATAAIGGLLVKFNEWLATTADANRNLRLTREAFAGNTKNAEAWGHIIDWASEKTALTTAQLNQLVIATEKTFRGFRLSGQGMVDAFKATSMAAGAGREDVADFFKELLERGKLSGRSFIAFPDLARFRNAGIDVTKVYKELGISSAQGLRGSLVSTDKLAAALAKVADNRFAEINAKKMLSLGNQWDRLKDNFTRFTNDLSAEGGALEPLLKALKQVADLFDLTTESGQELKRVITAYGGAISTAIVANLPAIKSFVVEGIRIAGLFLEATAAVVRFSQSGTGLFLIQSTLTALAATMAGIVIVGAAVAAAFVAIGAAIVGLGKLVEVTVDPFFALTRMDWASIGTAIVDGIKSGLEAAIGGLKAAVADMGEGIKSTFKEILGISSPSKAFARYGLQSGQGYQQGIKAASGPVASSSAAMATTATSAVASTSSPSATAAAAQAPPSSSQSAPSQAASSGRTVTVGTIENHFHISGGNAEEVKAALSSHSFLEDFGTTIRQLLQSQGYPTGTPATSGG